MELRKINTFGLVYTINGTNTDLKPLLLTAHQDVVPVADASTWTYPPFEAHYDGDWLWGRGASDDKNSLTGVMSALETLLSNETWIPRRTVILAFGFDEECGGLRGANHISQDLQDIYGPEGIAMILDEGGMGIKQLGNTLYAMPAVMEKGHVDIWYELHVAGGHSSIPFPHTGIGIISEVVQALEAHPYEPELRPESPLFQHLVCQARYTPSAQPRITDLVRAGNLEGLQDELISMGRTTQYRMQTSQSVDILRAGQKINAMPEVVVLGVNYRVAPQDSIVDIQHKSVHVIRGIAEKYGIKVRAFEGDEEYAAYSGGKVEGDAINFRAQETIDYNATLVITASQKTYVTAISPTTGPIWDLFSGTLQHTFAFDGGRVVPVGELMTGNTDGRYYQSEISPSQRVPYSQMANVYIKGVTPHVYRFVPLREDWRMNAHTVDERIKMEGHMEILRFYYDLVRNFDASHA